MIGNRIMPKKSEFAEHICDILSGFGVVTYRAMFGGFGIYLDGLIFAIIVDEKLYLKVGSDNVGLFKDINSNPFSYKNSKGRDVKMSYWEVPVEVLDDNEGLEILARSSIDIAKMQNQKKA